MSETISSEAEHWGKIDAAQAAVTKRLYELAAEFGKDSSEELLVRQAEIEDWDIARRKILLSELVVKLQRQKPKP